MNIGLAWVLYVVVVLVIYLLLKYTHVATNLDQGTILFLAFLVGALIVFIIAPGISLNTSDDRTWYGLLIFFAFLIPIVMAVWLVMSRRWLLPGSENQCVLERTIECTPGQGCRLVDERQYRPSSPRGAPSGYRSAYEY